MTFSRDDAEAHARAFFNKVCEDGQIVTWERIVHLDVLRAKPPKHPKADWDAVFSNDLSHPGEWLFFIKKTDPSVRHPTGIDHHSRVNDCTHFVSECLRKAGLPHAPAENSTPRMVDILRLRNDTKTLALAVDKAAAERIIKLGLMKKGDVIAYSRGSTKGKPSYVHMAIRVGQEGIACHTRCRFDEPWPIASDFNFTFVHFAHDDPAPHALGVLLEGWWKVHWRGTDYYYFYERNGKVGYTTLKPVHLKHRAVTFNGSGYWFDQGAERHVICWTSTGSVEKFSFAMDKRTLRGFWNDGETLLGQKL